MSVGVTSSTKRKYCAKDAPVGTQTRKGTSICRGHGGSQTADGDAEGVACTAQGVDAPEVTDGAYECESLDFRMERRGRGDMDVEFVPQKDIRECARGGLPKNLRAKNGERTRNSGTAIQCKAFRGASTPVDSLEDRNAEEEVEELGHSGVIAGAEKRRTRKAGTEGMRRGLSEGAKSCARRVWHAVADAEVHTLPRHHVPNVQLLQNRNAFDGIYFNNIYFAA
ncbi:hypothetical protein C8R45DRAFT_944252 [Mycena sanguinolenta]|nr:hypothetical protein C8R45DRAFT_944252 [Mycena sanguinolenta]